jgi:hypothetical protein
MPLENVKNSIDFLVGVSEQSDEDPKSDSSSYDEEDCDNNEREGKNNIILVSHSKR